MEQAIFGVGKSKLLKMKHVSKVDKNVMNGVPVARHGLPRGPKEAHGLQKLSKYLPGAPEAVFGPTTTQIVQNRTKNNQKSPGPY